MFLGNEHTLFYIRMHYLHFLKLYTKPYNKKQTEAEEVSINVTSSAISPEKRTNQIKTVMCEPEQDSLYLSKLHLNCLFAIAKNRNEKISRKFY